MNSDSQRFDLNETQNSPQRGSNRGFPRLDLGPIVRSPWLALALFVGTAASLGGCEKDAGPLPDNRPPETYLVVQGADLDTTDYRQIMEWWGTDPDGRVVGYCIHWDGGWTPLEDAPRCEFDEEFVFTTATVDTFVVPLDAESASRTFTVYAMDDDGALDPEGESQTFDLRSWVPEIDWSESLSRPTVSLPAVSFAVSASDLDGKETLDYFRAWLDGEDPELAARTFVDSVFALGLDDFAGRYGERTLYVQVVDEARTVSRTISHTWTVEPPPTEHYLLIDGISSRTPGESVHDNFYKAVMDSIAPNDYFTYDVELRGTFRTQAEVGPLFGLFDGVLWYGGGAGVQPEDDAAQFHNLALAEVALPDYLDAGGDILIIYHDAVGDTAALTPAFAENILGVDDYYRVTDTGEDDIDVRRGMVVASVGLAPGDSLETTSSNVRANFMIPAADAVPLFSVAPGFLDPTIYTPEQTEPALLGIASNRRPGTIGVVTFRLSAGSDRRGNAMEATIGVVREVLE
ncbi:MAG: hypothetical protein R3E97_20465 [Candidatus Eisenbacteria bacterium]